MIETFITEELQNLGNVTKTHGRTSVRGESH
uniref:Uncharacterized protein n=1 Tax=Rhizophora mucronata TaxID=61149 RepID=A0A2P2JA03_RHIMU